MQQEKGKGIVGHSCREWPNAAAYFSDLPLSQQANRQATCVALKIGIQIDYSSRIFQDAGQGIVQFITMPRCGLSHMRNRPETTSFIRKRLPHWEVADGRYFVTLCQRGAIPADAAENIRQMRRDLEKLKGGPALDLHRRIFREMENWLDRKGPVCDMVRPAIAAIVQEAIEHRVKRGEWIVLQYVIMPSHIHLFIKMLERSLVPSISAFKKWTGHGARQLLGPEGERFWGREWFDHWSRSPEEDERIVNYIRQNPVKAGMVEDYKSWPYGSW